MARLTDFFCADTDSGRLLLKKRSLGDPVLWSLGYYGVSGSLKSGLIGDPRSELSDQVNRWNAEGGKESSGDDLSQTRDRADGEGSSAQMNGFVTRLTDSEAITNGWYARCDAERLRRRRREWR